MKTVNKYLLVIIILISSIKGYSQIGIGVQNMAGGSGHGTIISPVVSYKISSHTLSFGLNYQKEKMNRAGFNAAYKYTMMEGDNIDLYSELSVIYHKDAFLSKNMKSLFAMNEQDVSNLQFRTIEQYAGFGAGIKFLKYAVIDLGIGIGSYETLNKANYAISNENASLRAANNMSLLVKAGLSLRLR